MNEYDRTIEIQMLSELEEDYDAKGLILAKYFCFKSSKFT